MKNKIIFLVILSILTSSFFYGCGINKENEIVIWSHLGDKETNEIKNAAEEWGRLNGIKLKVHSDRGDNRAYIEAVKHGIGPDIEIGVPHNKLEKLRTEQLLAEVPEKLIDKNKYVDVALDTVKYNNKLYGLPLTFSSYAVYYNKDKIKNPPETMEQLIELGKKYGFEYDINNFYLSYSFIASQGGYVFGEENGVYNVQDIGLNNEGAIEGYKFLQDLTQKYKVIPSDIEGIKARKDFEAGKTAFYINGPWDLEEINKSDISFATIPLPLTKGKITPSYVTVETAYVSSKSKNINKSWEVLEYILEKTPVSLFDINGKIPARKDVLDAAKFKNNEKLSAFIYQANNAGIPIPNVTELQGLQDAPQALKLLTSGKISPKECGESIVKSTKAFIKKLHEK